MAWSARPAADLGSPVTPMLPHISAWRRRDRLLSIQKRCGGCMPVAAHTRPGRRRALAWSDRLAADLGSPVRPMLSLIFARVVYANDFCPFRNGAGAACPWPRTLGKGVGEHWRGLTGWLPTLGLRSDRCFHTYWHGRRRDRLLSIQKRCGGCIPVAARTRPGRRIAMAWSDRLAADLGSPVSPMLAHILAWASTRPVSTIEILGSAHSPCHQGQLPIGIVGGGYQPHCRSVLAVKVCACRNF
jgi:hypothetical protein